jgi:hypothetical protein
MKTKIVQYSLGLWLVVSFWTSQMSINQSQKLRQTNIYEQTFAVYEEDRSLLSRRIKNIQLSFENIKKDGLHRCGAKKCLLPLKNETRIGYLVANRRAPGLFDAMQKAYNMSLQVIGKEYGMAHIYLAPPTEMEINDRFRNFLLQKRSIGYKGQATFPKFPRNKIIVQAVETIHPEKSILFGCERARLLDGVRQLPNLLDFVNNMTVMEAQRLIQIIASDFNKLRRILNEYPCLYDDFQAFLTQKGRIVHLDVDRCFDSGATYRGKREGPICRPILKYFESKILDHIASMYNITAVVYEWEK